MVTGHHWAPKARFAAVLRASRALISRSWCQGAPTPASLPTSPNAEAPPLRIPLQRRAQKLPSSPSPLVAFASPVLKCLGMTVPVEPSPHPDPKSSQLQRFSEPPTPLSGCLQSNRFRENKPPPSLWGSRPHRHPRVSSHGVERADTDKEAAVHFCPTYLWGGRKSKAALTIPTPPGFGTVVLGATERERGPREGHSGCDHPCLFLRTSAKGPRSAC